MEPAESRELSESQSRAVATKIREQLARKHMSRQRLADDARISISTLEKALNGSRPFTFATIVRLEAALGIALRPADATAKAKGASPSAPDELGGYSRAAVQWLEGDYLTLRPSFEVPEAIYAYRTEIFWDGEHPPSAKQSGLDAPFSQKGVVSVPNKSGHIYLHTNEQDRCGWPFSGARRSRGVDMGLLTTLLSGSGTQLLPIAVPLALIPRMLVRGAIFGRIAKPDAEFRTYHDYLHNVLTGDFARMIAA